MIISGFGPQANTQFPLRTVPTAESGLRGGSETSVTSNNNSVKSTELTTTLFQSVPASPSTNQSTSSKSELSNIEANRRRFELQTESQNASGMTGRRYNPLMMLLVSNRRTNFPASMVLISTSS